jgi:GNAT superfamily N-acetyltransferase
MTNIQIRNAAESDLPELLRLYRGLDADGRDVLDMVAAVTIFRRAVANPNHAIYVADIGGVIVGTFALLVMENLAHRGAPSAIVEDVVVDEQRRGVGIGKAMMEFAMAAARSRGCYKLALSSNLRREQAHEFYRSIGFEQHGMSFRVDLTPRTQKGGHRPRPSSDW